MTINYRVNLGFAKYSDANLVKFGSSVIACMKDNASFPSPTVKIADVTVLHKTYSDAVTAAALGGKHLTAAKRAARTPFVTALRSNAAYVQSVATQDAVMMLTSGYLINSTSRTSMPLLTPNILQLVNGISTQLLLSIKGVTNAKSYEVQLKTGTGSWATIGIYSYTRNIILPNLTPGTVYSVQVRATGGSTGYSGWSNPVSCMST
jgi:hypothetical protein